MRNHLENRVSRRTWTNRPSGGEPAFPRVRTPKNECSKAQVQKGRAFLFYFWFIPV
jgi:hypothetical protein